MEKESHELFKKRWESKQKMGIYKYSFMLATMYSATIVFISLLWDYKDAKDLPFSQILTLFDADLAIKTGTFFVFGIVFGVYHFRKSEKKYKEDL